MNKIVCVLSIAAAVGCNSNAAPSEDSLKPSKDSVLAKSSKGIAARASKDSTSQASKASANSAPKGPFAESTAPAMRAPSKAKDKAPATFAAKFVTTAGDFTVSCTRSWAENGVDRFYNLVKIGFFNDNALFRVIPGFVVQWGIHGNPDVSKHWRDAKLAADEVKGSNKRGYLTFAMAGSPDSRTTQLFINYKHNARLDGMGFAPICEVTGDGMKVVDAFHASYKGRPSGQQGRIQAEGNKFLRKSYPKLDYIKSVALVADGGSDTTVDKAEKAGKPSAEVIDKAGAKAAKPAAKAAASSKP